MLHVYFRIECVSRIFSSRRRKWWWGQRFEWWRDLWDYSRSFCGNSRCGRSDFVPFTHSTTPNSASMDHSVLKVINKSNGFCLSYGNLFNLLFLGSEKAKRNRSSRPSSRVRSVSKARQTRDVIPDLSLRRHDVKRLLYDMSDLIQRHSVTS